VSEEGKGREGRGLDVGEGGRGEKREKVKRKGS
jgi:hypothetical protein